MGQDLSNKIIDSFWPYCGTLLIAPCAARPSPGTRGHRTLETEKAQLDAARKSGTTKHQWRSTTHFTSFYRLGGTSNNIQQPSTTINPSFHNQKDHQSDVELVGGLVAIFYFQIYIGLLIIPIDELIFFRGVAQPPTSWKMFLAVFDTENCPGRTICGYDCDVMASMVEGENGENVCSGDAANLYTHNVCTCNIDVT